MSVHSNNYETDEEYERDLCTEYRWDRFNEYHEEGDYVRFNTIRGYRGVKRDAYGRMDGYPANEIT